MPVSLLLLVHYCAIVVRMEKEKEKGGREQGGRKGGGLRREREELLGREKGGMKYEPLGNSFFIVNDFRKDMIVIHVFNY